MIRQQPRVAEMPSRNPYHVHGEPPRLRNSVVAYFDILGYTDFALQASQSGAQDAALRSLHLALSGGRQWVEDSYRSSQTPDFPAWRLSKDSFALKAFTDNIVIGWPIRDDAESELGQAFMRLMDFQFHMTAAGFFVRGGLAVGPAYVDEIVVFGDAFLEAHDAEARLARDPRIVLTPAAIEACQLHLKYYANPKGAPQTEVLLKDSDAQWFLNYLQAVVYAADDVGPHSQGLLEHKAIVEARLQAFKEHPPVWSKYAWVARYHNYFCELQEAYFDSSYKIEVDLFRSPLSRIID